MRVGSKSAAVWAVPMVVMALAAALIATDLGGIAAHLRAIQFDAYQFLHKRSYEDPRARTGYSVRVLDLGEDNPYGTWPLSHAMAAKLLADLKTAGAALVVLDMPIAKADPLSPRAFASALPPGPRSDAARNALLLLPTPDTLLADAIGSVHTVTGFTLGAAGAAALEPKRAVEVEAPKQALALVPGFKAAHLPLEGFVRPSAGLGARNLPPAADGKLRAMPLLFRLGDRLVPSLDGEVMRLVSGGAPLKAIASERGLSGLDSRELLARVTAGPLSVPVRADGALDIYFSGPQAARLLSAADLDGGKIAPGSLARTIIYVSPPGESVATPLGREGLGEVRAEAIENVLLGTALKSADGLYGGLAFLLIVGVGIALLAARSGLLWAGLLAASAIAGAQAFTWYLFAQDRLLFDSITPSFALAAVFGAAFAARGFEIRRTGARLRQAFADALPRQAFEQIARRPDLLALDGETRTVTCLSCGIRGYAALAESFADDPVGFTRLIGTVTAPLVEAAIRHGAMVDDVGAGHFNAYWNAPLDDGEHAIHACEAANRMTVALAEVNEQLSRERRFDGTAFDPVEIGIGISTGPAVAGGFEARGRFTYAVSGDCTLLADRVRAQSGQYGPAIVVSDDTRKAAERGFAFLEVDFLACGPRGEPVKLYAMLGNPLVRASPKFRALATFHEHIFQSLRTRQWEKTRELIDQCRKLSGASQKLYELHLARIAWFEQHPPGEDWDGAFRPAVK